MRDILLILHILAAATWFGANVTQVVVTRKLTSGGGATAAAWMNSTVTMGRVLYMPAGIVAFVTGFGLVGVSSKVYQMESAFTIIGILMILVGVAFGIRIFGPAGREAAAAFEAGDTSKGQALVQKVATFGLIDTVLLLVTITAMVMKWGN